MKIEFVECCGFACCRNRLAQDVNVLRELKRVFGLGSFVHGAKEDTDNLQQVTAVFTEKFRGHQMQCMMGIGAYGVGITNRSRRLTDLPECEEIYENDLHKWLFDNLDSDTRAAIIREHEEELDRYEAELGGQSSRWMVTRLKLQHEYTFPRASDNQHPEQREIAVSALNQLERYINRVNELIRHPPAADAVVGVNVGNAANSALSKPAGDSVVSLQCMHDFNIIQEVDRLIAETSAPSAHVPVVEEADDQFEPTTLFTLANTVHQGPGGLALPPMCGAWTGTLMN